MVVRRDARRLDPPVPGVPVGVGAGSRHVQQPRRPHHEPARHDQRRRLAARGTRGRVTTPPPRTTPSRPRTSPISPSGIGQLARAGDGDGQRGGQGGQQGDGEFHRVRVPAVPAAPSATPGRKPAFREPVFGRRRDCIGSYETHAPALPRPVARPRTPPSRSAGGSGRPCSCAFLTGLISHVLQHPPGWMTGLLPTRPRGATPA